MFLLFNFLKNLKFLIFGKMQKSIVKMVTIYLNRWCAGLFWFEKRFQKVPSVNKSVVSITMAKGNAMTMKLVI